jgi:hypothetical protein
MNYTRIAKKGFKLTLVALLFYVIGRLAYEYFYQLTLFLIELFSTVPIRFFGKFPYMFGGDPKFGLILACIPMTVFVINKFFHTRKIALLKSILIYTFYFIITYILFCWINSINLLTSNAMFKDGAELCYSIREVNLNQAYLTIVIISTILTTITLLLVKLISKFKKRKENTLEN